MADLSFIEDSVAFPEKEEDEEEEEEGVEWGYEVLSGVWCFLMLMGSTSLLST